MFHTGFWLHDSAAALIEDGRVVAAIEEERLSRCKHAAAFPRRAIEFCLAERGVSLADVDLIAINQTEEILTALGESTYFRDPRAPLELGADRLVRMLSEFHGVDVRDKIRFCNHHHCHAHSAIWLSGFERSLVATFDGWGENGANTPLSGLIGVSDGMDFKVLREDPAHDHSLGEWYRETIRIMGYFLFDEYKAMGLAPYGDPERYADLMSKWFEILPDGDFVLRHRRDGVLREFLNADLLTQARRKGGEFTQFHKDIAQALQVAVEEIILHVLTHFQKETGERSLCLAGGVTHNCSANGKVLYSGLFDRIFVQPAAHDAGTAVGAAYHAAVVEGERIQTKQLSHVYLGPDIGPSNEVETTLSRWDKFISFERCSEIEKRTAEFLAAGDVVGWVQGRSEFGPRALGNRSILADPRPADNKGRINEMVKKREGFRPFAPSVLVEHAPTFFDIPPGPTDLSFMIFVVRVQPDKQSLLGAITHVDGTARIQTVSREVSPQYYELIDAFGKLTGVPIVLNTSFNNHAEPIVDSVDDAVACFLTTGLNRLVVGEYLIEKRGLLADNPERCLDLVPWVLPSRLLVRRGTVGGAFRYEVEQLGPLEKPPRPISEAMYRVVAAGADAGTVRERAAQLDLGTEDALRELSRELFDLWVDRVVLLMPPGAAPWP